MEEVEHLFSAETNALIREWLHVPAHTVSLRLRDQHPEVAAFVALQVEARQKFGNKFPELLEKNWRFYSRQALEQASSEALARYKAGCISGNRGLDLTGGAGADSYFFSSSFQQWEVAEQNEMLAAFLSFNFGRTKSNVNVLAGSGLKRALAQDRDFLYADPDRRVNNRRVHGLDQAEPNLLPHLDQLLARAPRLWIKASPLLDVQAARTYGPNLEEIELLGHQGECKEVLLKFGRTPGKPVVTVTLAEGGIIRNWCLDPAVSPAPLLSPPANYLFDPHPAMRKSGLFHGLSVQLQLPQLAPSTPLFTSASPNVNFPGKTFRVLEVLDGRSIKSRQFEQLNISVRNAKPRAEDLHRQWRIKPGGDLHLYWCTLSDGSTKGLLCEPLGTAQENNFGPLPPVSDL